MSQLTFDGLLTVGTITEARDENSVDSLSREGTPNVFEEMLRTGQFDEVNKKTQKGEKYMVDKFTPHKILGKLEKIQLIEIEREIGESALSMIEFVNIMLKHLHFQASQREYLTVGLIELFRDVVEYQKKVTPSLQQALAQHLEHQYKQTIKWSAITGYFIDNVIQGNQKKGVIPNKYISKSTSEKFQQVYNSDKLDQFAPDIVGGSALCLRRFRQSQKFIDSYHHSQGIRNVEFIKETKQIVVLDNLTDQIHFYNEHSQKIHQISPHPEHHIVDTGILYFTYSVQEKRIGACLQDYRLAFWDQADNFTYEKSFSPHLELLQIFIKYVEFCTTWMTIDQRNNIYVWDIEKETCVQLPKRHDERITDVCEITHLKLLAACSLDKKIIFWDLVQKVPAQILKLEGVSSHSICYCMDFRVLATAQYENHINIWSFEGKDCSILSKLNGHNAQITAIHILKDTPLLISADEIGFLKTWDIRNGTCVQTIHFECKSSIHQFVNINDQRFIGAEYRLHWFEFEDKAVVNANGIEFLNMNPISIRYNHLYNQLAIATKSDVRLVNIRSGQTEKIIANLVKDEEGDQPSDITQFVLTDDCKKFVVGNNKGQIKTYQYLTSQLETINTGHAQEITTIKLDTRNDLMISAGWDSLILVQKMQGLKRMITKILVNDDSADMTDDFDYGNPNRYMANQKAPRERKKNKDEVDERDEISQTFPLRQIKNAHFSHEISAIQFSLRLSMIATSSNGIICVWDYETFRLIGAMTNNQTDVQVLEFLDPFPLLASLDLSGTIVIWEPLVQFGFSFKIYLPAVFISLQYKSESEESSYVSLLPSKMVKDFVTQQDFDQMYTTKNDRQHSHFQRFKEAVQVCRAYKKTKRAMVLFLTDDLTGQIFVLELQTILKSLNLDTKSQNCGKRREHNAFRTTTNNSNGIFQSEQDLLNEFKKVENELLAERRTSLLRSSLANVLGSKLNVKSQLSSGQNTLQPSSPRQLMRPHQRFNLDTVLHFKFKAASEAIFVLTVVNIPPKLLITGTASQVVRIWSIFGDLLCVLDIDKPLPYLWKIKISSFDKRKKKYQEAVKLLTQIDSGYIERVLSPKKDRSNLFRDVLEQREEIRRESMDDNIEQVLVVTHEASQEQPFKIQLKPNPTVFEANAKKNMKQASSIMALSHHKFFQNENEQVTFQRFLSQIEKEDKLLKNPKKHSLKIMEARKTKTGQDQYEEPEVKPVNAAEQVKFKLQESTFGPGNKQASNLMQFSLLDKIEGMINAQKKSDAKTKDWERAYDEDIKHMKKLRKFQDVNQNFTEDERNLAAKSSIKMLPNISIRENAIIPSTKRSSHKNNSVPPQVQTIPIVEVTKMDVQTRADDDTLPLNDKSISSYQSAHLIPLFIEQGIQKPTLFIEKSSLTVINKNESFQASMLGPVIPRLKMDWLSYAQSKCENLPQISMSNRNRDGSTTITMNPNDPSSSMMTSAHNRSVTQHQTFHESKKMRNIIFKELDMKRKFFKKNFATIKDYQYVDNFALQEEHERQEPPDFIKQLNAQKKLKGKTPRNQVQESYLAKFKESGDEREGNLTHRTINRKGSTLLPNLKNRL